MTDDSVDTAGRRLRGRSFLSAIGACAGALAGELIDTHAAEGAALNTPYAQEAVLDLVFPFFITTEATLESRFDGDALHLRAEGEAVSAFTAVAFAGTVEAIRTN